MNLRKDLMVLSGKVAIKTKKPPRSNPERFFEQSVETLKLNQMKSKGMKLNTMNTSKMRDDLNNHLEIIDKRTSILDLDVDGQNNEIYFLDRLYNRIDDLLDDLDYYDNCKRKKLVIQRQ